MASVPPSTHFENYHWQQSTVLPSFNSDNRLQFKKDNACVQKEFFIVGLKTDFHQIGQAEMEFISTVSIPHIILCSTIDLLIHSM